MLLTALLLAAAADTVDAANATAPEVILVLLIDDLGFADIRPHGPLSPTPHIGALAAAGVELANMHAYKVCSPSRRSLLSGRFAVGGTSGAQAPICSNFLPLEMTLLPGKLRQATGPAGPFSTHFIGKGHLGYQTTDHLPVRRGFDTHLGYLAGDQNYAHGLQARHCLTSLSGVNPTFLAASSWLRMINGHPQRRVLPSPCPSALDARPVWR